MASREQFEAWFKPRKERMKSDGICTLNIVRYRGMAWAGWQASREAVEVELPQRQSICASGYGNGYFVACNDGDGLEYDDVVEAIRAAGIKVKGE